MPLVHGVLLFLAAMLAGAMNSVAGGGSFISFPTLIFTGVPPIPANATSTVALWPGSVAAIGAYGEKLPRNARLLVPLTLSSLGGGLMGALILLRTPQATFMHLVPYLFLVATLLFTFGKRLSQWLGAHAKISGRLSWAAVSGAAVAQLFIAVYGGFFGGGIGILMLALLAMVRMEDIHSMNALKSLLAAAINGAAVVTFIVARAVFWPQALVMIVGATLGGYGGASLAQKLDPRWVRAFVIVVGFSMTVYFLWRY
ncbi:MAG: sulfite exporter TauE/SafE family protein [Terriglobia bacterium]